MSAPPLISIVMPARNAAATLAQALDSLLAQTEADWEAIIVNDGSTDATAAIIASYIARDKRFSVLAGPGSGVASARNLGLAAARGKYLHFLDADDWNDPKFYKKMLAAVHGTPDAAVAFCYYCRVLPGGLITEPFRIHGLEKDPFEDFARGCPLAIHAILLQRERIVQLGGFDTTLGNCEDWDLWLRVARLPGKWILVEEGLAYYRTDATSLSRNAEWLLANSRIVLGRSFDGDDRMAGMPDARTEPPSVARGVRAQSYAYNALWTAGMSCGGGDSGKDGADMLRPFCDARTEASPIATVLLEGLVVGARALPEQMAERWPNYGPRLTELIRWLGEQWNDPRAARAIQYHIEEKILYADSSRAPRRLALSQAVRVDMNNPPVIVPEPGVDRFHVSLVEGEKIRSTTSLAVLGPFTEYEWREVGTALARFSYRDLRKLGPRAAARLVRRAVSLVLRQPELLRRRSNLRAALRMKLSAIAAPAVTAARPGTHTARLAEIKAWAEAFAREHAGAARVEQLKKFKEDVVDPSDRKGHFETVFETEDPWGYGSAYEQQKYQRQLEMLPSELGRALEIGCAEGHFTVQLAPRVGQLLAADISKTALSRTQARCARYDNVDYQVLDLSAGPIPGDMDVIVCSEILYYLSSEAELRKIAPLIVAALRPGGSLIMAHAHNLADNKARTGFDWGIVYGADVINRVFSELPGLALEYSLDTELYRIDRLRRLGNAAEPVTPVFATAPLVEALSRELTQAVVWGGATVLRSEAKAREQRFQVPVLMYHGVADDGPDGLTRYRVSPSAFKAQMRWLRANGFYAIGSGALLEHIGRGAAFAGRPVVISFDDGFQNFADNAWPILLAHDFTAEMFIVTDRVGKTAIWDQDKGEPARLMDAATIARLAAEGALFGSHMATHTALDGLSAEALVKELAGSRAMLAQWVGQPPISFAAPFAIEDTRLRWTARQCGYQIGFRGEGGAARLDMNPLSLPRVEVRGDRPLEEFVARMEATL